jgi:Mce-associated membrane protein
MRLLPYLRGRARVRTARRRVVALALAVVVVGGAAGAAWYGQHRTRQRDAATKACLAAATPASQAIFSYDYRTFDASIANGRGFVTGAFAKEYATTTASLRATAVKEQAVVQAQVSTVGVIESSTTQVRVLVYLNQYRRNSNITGEKVDQDRVLLTLVPVAHGCRVSAASAI